MNIGFIGLGILGSRMAANLQKHAHNLVVYSTDFSAICDYFAQNQDGRPA